MLLIVGLVIVLGSVVLGYVAHHGNLLVLWQWTEFVIIGGAGLGALIVGNPPSVLKGIGRGIVGLLKPSPYSEKSYGELLQVLYDIFQKARKDGLVGLEAHIEEPEKSDIFQKYPNFTGNHHALDFLCDDGGLADLRLDQDIRLDQVSLLSL